MHLDPTVGGPGGAGKAGLLNLDRAQTPGFTAVVSEAELPRPACWLVPEPSSPRLRADVGLAFQLCKSQRSSAPVSSPNPLRVPSPVGSLGASSPVCCGPVSVLHLWAAIVRQDLSSGFVWLLSGGPSLIHMYTHPAPHCPGVSGPVLWNSGARSPASLFLLKSLRSPGISALGRVPLSSSVCGPSLSRLLE